MKIVIDVAGGDNSPFAQISAGIKAVKTTDAEIIFVGDEEKIKKELKKYQYDEKRVKIVDAKEVIENTEKPVEAVKNKKSSTIVVASKLIKEGKADALVSSGSTGALLVCGQMIIGRIKGIKRAAIGSILPTKNGGKMLMDSGANTDCSDINLVQFAKMASAYMQYVEKIDNPKIGLLSNGTEDQKGTDIIKLANELLRNTKLNFIGNVEGRDVMYGNADVYVCDGFSGNLVLKAIEGTASVITKKIKEIYKKNIFTMIGALFVKKEISEFKRTMDYREYGGAPLLGVNAVMIKAHGSSDEKAFYNAVLQAYRAVKCNVCDVIKESIKDEKMEELKQ